MIKLLATGDLHLGRSSTAISAGGVLPTREVWNLMVDYAIRHQADAILLSGDIIDRENRFFEAVGALLDGFDKLQEAGIAVFMVSGNHDFDVLPSIITEKHSGMIHLLGQNGAWEEKSFERNNTAISFVGWSFPTQHVFDSPLSDLADKPLNAANIRIGLLHGDLFAASHYAPLNISDLRRKGVQFWLLGHIHKPFQNVEQGVEIHYPGSPQALSPKEKDTHGPLWLEISQSGEIRIRHLALSPVRYEDLRIDVSETENEHGVRSLLLNTLEDRTKEIRAEEMMPQQLVFDLHVSGSYAEPDAILSIFGQNLQDFDRNLDGMAVRIRKAHVHVTPAIGDISELAKQASPVGLLADYILKLEQNSDAPEVVALSKAWLKQYEQLSTQSAYQPLRQEGRDRSPVENHKELGKDYLLDTAYRLLGEMLQQTREN